jgi:hypothetical protein
MMEQVQDVTKAITEGSLLTYMASIGVLGGVTLGAAEGVGRTLKTMPMFADSKRIKLKLALLLGPGMALIAHGAGYLNTPAPGAIGGWVMAGAFGLAGTFLAKGGKDAINKVTGRKKKKS